jgi:hypothetical protein
VEEHGNVVDENDKPIGEVFPGDLFTRYDPPNGTQNAYRYYGTVEGKDLTGWVMQSKLTPNGTVCD